VTGEDAVFWYIGRGFMASAEWLQIACTTKDYKGIENIWNGLIWRAIIKPRRGGEINDMG
jgi:hypothetical protein